MAQGVPRKVHQAQILSAKNAPNPDGANLSPGRHCCLPARSLAILPLTTLSFPVPCGRRQEWLDAFRDCFRDIHEVVASSIGASNRPPEVTSRRATGEEWLESSTPGDPFSAEPVKRGNRSPLYPADPRSNRASM